MKELARWRKTIDKADRGLVKLLNARAGAVLAIGRWKRLNDVPVYDPRREAEIAKKVQALNEGPLDDVTMKRLFERIIDEFRAFERAHQDAPLARDRAIRRGSAASGVRRPAARRKLP